MELATQLGQVKTHGDTCRALERALSEARERLTASLKEVSTPDDGLS